MKEFTILDKEVQRILLCISILRVYKEEVFLIQKYHVFAVYHYKKQIFNEDSVKHFFFNFTKVWLVLKFLC